MSFAVERYVLGLISTLQPVRALKVPNELVKQLLQQLGT